MPEFLVSVAFRVFVANKNFSSDHNILRFPAMIIAKKSSAVLALTAVIFQDFVGDNKFSR